MLGTMTEHHQPDQDGLSPAFNQRSSWPYAVAVISPVLALALTKLLEPWLAPSALPFFFAAVALSAWAGGLGPGLVATALSAFALETAVLESTSTGLSVLGKLPRVTAFALVAGLVSWLNNRRRAAEAEVRAALAQVAAGEQQLRLIADAVPALISYIDAEGRYRFVNRRYEEWFGRPRERFLGYQLPEILDPEVYAVAQPHVVAALAGHPVTYEAGFSYAAAGPREVEVNYVPDVGEDGTVRGFVALVVDVTERKQAEAQVRALATIVESSDDAIIGYTLDGIITSWNPGAEQLYGYTAAEAMGKPLSLIIPPEQAEELADIMMRLRLGERIEHHETIRLTKDGRHLDVSVSIAPIIDNDGSVVGAATIARDITRQKRAEEQQRLLAEAGVIFASSLDVVTTLETVAGLVVPRLADWCIVHLVGENGALAPVVIAHADPARAAMARQLAEQYPIEPATGGVVRVVRTGNAELIPEVTETMLAVAASDAEHLAILRGFGLRSALVVPLTARGRRLGAISLMAAESGRRYDAQDLALAEELARRAALAVANARLYAEAQAASVRYRHLFEQAGEAILVMDGDGSVLDANAAATRLLGYSHEEFLAMRMGCKALLAGEPELTAAQWERIRNAGEWHGEITLQRRDGATIPGEAHIARVDLPSGPAYLALCHDTSERHALEHLREEILATASHDLKNPLTAIRANAQLLNQAARSGSLDQADLSEGLVAIDVAAARMVRLIEDITDAARLRLGQVLPLDLQETDLVQVVQGTVDQHRLTTASHILRLETEVPALVGQWDAHRLERAVGNLLTNAIKYSPAGSEIVVRLTHEEEGDNSWATLSVIDHGIGIPEADLPHLFERFRRASNVGAVAGTGLGLTGVKQIIEQHGGTVTVKSIEGQGSTFTIRLPMGCDTPIYEVPASPGEACAGDSC